MIYILQGSTGAYEDSYTWVVRAYTNYEQAYADCKKAEEEAEAYCDEVKLLNKGFYSTEHTDKDYDEFQEMLECTTAFVQHIQKLVKELEDYVLNGDSTMEEPKGILGGYK